MKRPVLIIVLLTFIFNLDCYSQKKGTLGLSGTVQEGQFGISIPIWIGEEIVLAPVIDFNFAEKVGLDLGIGLAPRYYFKTEKLAPYAGIRLGAIINKPSSDNEIDDETKIDLLFGLAFGGEYFVADQLSFGIEAQGNFTKSDKDSYRFGNPDGLNFNLGTMISATIYF